MAATVVEFVCLEDEVAVMVHVLEGTTPVKSFGGRPQLPASDDISPAQSSARSREADLVAPPLETCDSEIKEEAVAAAGAPPSSGAADGGETGRQEGAEPSSGATLDCVVLMLQRLLSASELASAAQRAAALAAAEAAPPLPAPTSSNSTCGSSGMELPEGVEKLLALELEVVQLQQSLQIAALEFESRTVQLHSLKQRADESEQRAQGAEQRAASLAAQVHQLERQGADLGCQLGEASARLQLETAQLAAQLAAAAARHQAAEEEAGSLRRQLQEAQQATAVGQAQLLRVVAQESGWQERAAALRQENQQLRGHMAAACGALRATGIPASQVFSRAALALAGSPGSMQSPPESPVGSPAVSGRSGGGELSGLRALPPRVPRLQLSSVSLQQLQGQLPQQEGGEADEAAGAARLPQTSAAAASVQLPGQLGPVMLGHVLAAGDSTDPASPGVPAEAGASPVGTSMQQGEGPPALLAAPALLRSVSPAQQELLAAAQQWQLSARSAVQDSIPAYRPQQLGQPPLGSARALSARPGTATGSNTARSARHQTPRAGANGGCGSAAATPGGRKQQLLQQRPTYGQDAAFLELKQAYHAVVSSEAERASRWARSIFSSSSAVETDPQKVEPMVQGLLQLFAENGVVIPLHKCGPCQYRLGSAKLAVRLVNGRLMARAGAGQTVDVFTWLEKQPLPRKEQEYWREYTGQ